MPRFLIFCLLLLSLTPLAFSSSAHYLDGLAAFEKKDFAAAKASFEAAIEKDQIISSDLLFNLGNTLFRLGDPGAAALWYRRALLLDPRDHAARQNLRLLQRRTGALVFDETLGLRVASWLKHTQWLWVFAAASWAAILALAILLFLKPRRSAKAWGWPLFSLAFLVAAASAAGVWGRLPGSEVAQRAVITQSGAAALAAPTETAGVIIDLPPGSEVAVKESRDIWSYVEIPGTPARVGWVRRQNLSPLWPYSSALVE